MDRPNEKFWTKGEVKKSAVRGDRGVVGVNTETAIAIQVDSNGRMEMKMRSERKGNDLQCEVRHIRSSFSSRVVRFRPKRGRRSTRQ